MTETYACIDGGQTKTAVFVLTDKGSLCENWEDQPLLHPASHDGLVRLRTVVGSVCGRLKSRLDGRAYGPLEAIVFSLTGYHSGDEATEKAVRDEARRHLGPAVRVDIIPDYVGNWTAATQGEPGILVISGGGSVAYGKNSAGVGRRLGGWGHLLGDVGSGYWIGLQAVKVVLEGWAGLTPPTALERAVTQHLGVTQEMEVMSKVYSGEITGKDFANLAPAVIAVASNGDGAAVQICAEAARHLSRLAEVMIAELGSLPIYLSGGVLQAASMRQRVEKELIRKGIRDPVFVTSPSPVEGIFLIAKQVR